MNENNQSELFSMQILKSIINTPISAYYCCHKIDNISNLDHPTETKENANKISKMHKELLLLANDSLIFLSKKEEKRRIFISNISKASIKSNVITIHLKKPMELNQYSYDFIIYNRNHFIQLLSNKYLSHSLLRTGQIEKLEIEFEVNKERYKTTSIAKMNSLMIDKDILNSKKCRFNGYCFDTHANLIPANNNEPNVFKWKKDSDSRQTHFKILIKKMKSIESLMANISKSNFKSHAMAKLSNSLKVYYSNYTEIILTSVKQIDKISQAQQSKWTAFEFTLKAKQTQSKRLNLIITFLRRKCIPPLYESYQDFAIILEEAFIDKYEFCDVEYKIKSVYDLIIQSLEPEEQEKENSITKMIVFQKIASYLVDPDTLEYFYLNRYCDCENRTKTPQMFFSLFRFSNDIKYKLLLIKEKYEKSDDIAHMKKKCLVYVSECNTQDNPININNYYKLIQRGYN